MSTISPTLLRISRPQSLFPQPESNPATLTTSGETGAATTNQRHHRHNFSEDTAHELGTEIETTPNLSLPSSPAFSGSTENQRQPLSTAPQGLLTAGRVKGLGDEGYEAITRITPLLTTCSNEDSLVAAKDEGYTYPEIKKSMGSTPPCRLFEMVTELSRIMEKHS
ncbi:Uu.00g134010.m01.CDS01 [Anthostomella pinea]|uniref:Uu.00g134010.m01.CDS01 n=1 Tax=Anthostomella pinea TaxID=933095 RepID=A0AAI8VNW1_9PEZI|nr:Uu.00g134010.m01.CDS01 [Anthostomella pinea]